MNLIPINLPFKELRARQFTRRLVIHHSASADVSSAEIHRWHLQRGWSGIGYHFVIRTDGSIEQGRPLETVGAHAGPEGNSDSIAVCLTGDFTRRRPAVKQIAALLELTVWIKGLYPSSLAVVRHCDIAATECPGQFFPWSDVLSALASPPTWKDELISRAIKEELLFDQHLPDDPAPKWFVAALVLNLLDRLRKP